MILCSRVNSCKSGFTLVETLIYIALFGVLLTGVVTTAYPLITGAERLSQRVTEEGETAFLLHKIGWALNESPITNIDDSNPNELRITKGSNSIYFRENTYTIEISVNGGGSWEPINNSRAIFSSFSTVFTAESGGVPATVEVSFEVNGKPYSKFYNVYVL